MPDITLKRADEWLMPWNPAWAVEQQRLTAAGLSKTYEGGCHCGRIAFEVTLAPPLDQGHVVLECNCSSCRRFGYLLAYTARENVRWKNAGGRSRCSTYQYNTKQSDHLFCSNCGSSIALDFCDRFAPVFTGYGISVRALKNIDLDTLVIYRNDGVNSVPPGGDLSGQWYDETNETNETNETDKNGKTDK